MKKGLLLGAAVAAAFAVLLSVSLAQSPAPQPPVQPPQPPVVMQPPLPVPSPQPAAVVAPGLAPLPKSEGGIAAVQVGKNTIATVKDHGDSQTIIVIKIDELGRIKMTDKKQFFY